jgi:hypothetical protein
MSIRHASRGRLPAQSSLQVAMLERRRTSRIGIGAGAKALDLVLRLLEVIPASATAIAAPADCAEGTGLYSHPRHQPEACRKEDAIRHA